MMITARIPVDKTREGKTILYNVTFLDSFQFMSSSLASLVKNLEILPFTDVLKKDFPGISDDIIKRNGVFPYTYFNSLSKLQETSLPAREAFRNDLNGEECSSDEYQFAQRAWQKANCTNFGDYLLLYLKLDVVHFVSLPGLSFMSAFKMTYEKIDLITDLEMYTFFELGIRGGMTFVNKHIVRNEEKTHTKVKLSCNTSHTLMRTTFTEMP